jgi:hypothetical protein
VDGFALVVVGRGWNESSAAGVQIAKGARVQVAIANPPSAYAAMRLPDPLPANPEQRRLLLGQEPTGRFSPAPGASPLDLVAVKVANIPELRRAGAFLVVLDADANAAVAATRGFPERAQQLWVARYRTSAPILQSLFPRGS